MMNPFSNRVMQLEALAKKQAADKEINWVTGLFMGLFHAGAVVALFFFTWKALLVAVVLWWISGSLGIGMGYHRLRLAADSFFATENVVTDLPAIHPSQETALQSA